jgi:phenylpropionate dioxygenase-like ring-hydroxylating dioxygenase large terminal subunit
MPMSVDNVSPRPAAQPVPQAPAAAPAGPPTFAEAKNRRQKVRSAGMDPNYWYAVEYDKKVKRGQVVGVRFWKRNIAVYRGVDGVLRAIEDRCAHRHLKLSLGAVEGCNLTCCYHGWSFGPDGKLAAIKHELFGKAMPRYQLLTYPVKVRYGLIWIFPGDPEKAESVPLPHIPDLEGPDAWPCDPIDFRWQAHHSMILENVNDFTHAFLHRKFRPFTDAKLTMLDVQDAKSRIVLRYETTIGDGQLSKYFVNRQNVDVSEIELGWEYPYQWSNTDGMIKHWCFVLPEDERTSRVFFLFHFHPKSLKVPFVPVFFPRIVMNPILKIANQVLVRPLLEEDGYACAAEQEGYEAFYDEPNAEMSPAVVAFQQLVIRKWEEALARESGSTHVDRHRA